MFEFFGRSWVQDGVENALRARLQDAQAFAQRLAIELRLAEQERGIAQDAARLASEALTQAAQTIELRNQTIRRLNRRAQAVERALRSAVNAGKGAATDRKDWEQFLARTNTIRLELERQLYEVASLVLGRHPVRGSAQIKRRLEEIIGSPPCHDEYVTLTPEQVKLVSTLVREKIRTSHQADQIVEVSDLLQALTGSRA